MPILMAIVRAVFRSAENLAVSLALGAAVFAAPAPAHSDAPTTCAPPPASTLTVNVKDRGAKGDGQTDDTASIQAAIDEVKGTKGTVLVPKGVYMIDAVKKRLKLRDEMTLKLAEGAVLKAIPNDAGKYSILTIDRASNVWVIGGTLEGDREQHQGKRGEWGHGIRIGKGAKNITVSNVISKKMWGDGFYVQDAEDVRFCGVTAEGNRRQGLSVIQVDGLLVLNSVFKNTHGAQPSAGIDFEPNRVEQKIANVRIVGSKFIDNSGPGILVAGKKARVTKIEMTRNTFRNNPVVVEYAPSLAAAICGNRETSTATEHTSGFNAYAEPIEMVALQNDCGSGGFVVDRQKKRKKPLAE